ncbi:DUF5675 family protein [Leyella stercorea]
MKIEVKRIALKDKYTIGHMYIDGKFVCDTLEDKVRDLNKNGKFDNGEVKIPNETAIPYGTYNVTMNIQSPKYSNYAKYLYVKKYNAFMPRLQNVPSFEGVLIHAGNTADHTSGCILVGENKIKGQVINSQKIWTNLMDKYFWPAKLRGEKITIEMK